MPQLRTGLVEGPDLPIPAGMLPAGIFYKPDLQKYSLAPIIIRQVITKAR
jgi:hypothetical protein